MTRIVTHWITQDAAKAFVRDRHRHHRHVVGAIFQLGAHIDGRLVGVVIVGRPSARMSARAADGRPRAEVTRLCVDEGYPNLCSHLYGRARRVAQAMGFNEMLTYTLASEPGISLRAAGWAEDGLTAGGDWSRNGRPRNTVHAGPKRRWVTS